MGKGLHDALRKASNLTTSAGFGGDFLPAPLADEFIGFVRDRNFARQLFRVVPMASKTRDIPKVLGGTKVYYESAEGTTARQTELKTGTIRLTAKKFMARIIASEEVLEDAQQDFDSIIRDHFSGQGAEAEEEAMMAGNTGHATTATESAANDTNWYVKDHRLAFDGLFTLAADTSGDTSNDTRAAVPVEGGAAAASTAHLREAMYNLGKYGRVMQDLIAILNPWSANQLLDDSKLVTLDKYGPQATIVTGEFGRLYGKISMINSAFAPESKIVVTHRRNPIIGDRRRIRLRFKDEVEDETRRYVLSERLDFTVEHKAALCLIQDLEGGVDIS